MKLKLIHVSSFYLFQSLFFVSSQLCEAGTYSKHVGDCKECDIGQYRQSNKKTNGVKEGTDPTACVMCPSGWSSVMGSSKCQECEAGKYGKPSVKDGICHDCPTGFSRKSTHSPFSSLTKCQQCEKGEKTTVNGSATCEKW